jgi:Ser-tRNA(Ala) deacylase AlaX
MSTIKLYEKSQITNFDANITAIRGAEVAFNQTAFYPASGGQPSDRGILRIGEIEYQVIDVIPEADEIWHKLERSPEATIGDQISGQIDSELRNIYSRYHTGLHILNGVIHRDCGAVVTGAQIYADRARMDFTLDGLNAELVKQIEKNVNEIIEEDRRVIVYEIPRKEALQIPHLIRTLNKSIPNNQKVRVVEIEGLDRQACGGTHVDSTAKVGGIQIIKTINKGRNNKRLEIVLTQ